MGSTWCVWDLADDSDSVTLRLGGVGAGRDRSDILFSRPLDMLSIVKDGLGGGAIGVPLYGMLGGYALSGRGHAGHGSSVAPSC